MAIVLYDLVGADDRRFSPNCWRTRMALAHKGLPHEARPTRFTEIGSICDGAQKTLPTMEDQGRVLSNSWTIAAYLEQRYPDRPSLFGGDAGLTRFLEAWLNIVVHPATNRMIVQDICDQLTPEDKDYFRATREKRWGEPLAQVQAGREKRLEDYRAMLQPLRTPLAEAPYLGGRQPRYADYLVFGVFQWARSVSRFKLLAADDPLATWFGRCLDLYDGIGRRAPGYD